MPDLLVTDYGVIPVPLSMRPLPRMLPSGRPDLRTKAGRIWWSKFKALSRYAAEQYAAEIYDWDALHWTP